MNKTKKLIAFPQNLIELVEIKANNIGFTFQEYVRYVLANDVKTITEQIEVLDEITEKDMAEAIDDIKNNRITSVSKDGISKHLREIASQA